MSTSNLQHEEEQQQKKQNSLFSISSSNRNNNNNIINHSNSNQALPTVAHLPSTTNNSNLQQQQQSIIGASDSNNNNTQKPKNEINNDNDDLANSVVVAKNKRANLAVAANKVPRSISPIFPLLVNPQQCEKLMGEKSMLHQNRLMPVIQSPKQNNSNKINNNNTNSNFNHSTNDTNQVTATVVHQNHDTNEEEKQAGERCPHENNTKSSFPAIAAASEEQVPDRVIPSIAPKIPSATLSALEACRNPTLRRFVDPAARIVTDVISNLSRVQEARAGLTLNMKNSSCLPAPKKQMMAPPRRLSQINSSKNKNITDGRKNKDDDDEDEKRRNSLKTVAARRVMNKSPNNEDQERTTSTNRPQHENSLHVPASKERIAIGDTNDKNDTKTNDNQRIIISSTKRKHKNLVRLHDELDRIGLTGKPICTSSLQMAHLAASRSAFDAFHPISSAHRRGLKEGYHYKILVKLGSGTFGTCHLVAYVPKEQRTTTKRKDNKDDKNIVDQPSAANVECPFFQKQQQQQPQCPYLQKQKEELNAAQHDDEKRIQNKSSPNHSDVNGKEPRQSPSSINIPQTDDISGAAVAAAAKDEINTNKNNNNSHLVCPFQHLHPASLQEKNILLSNLGNPTSPPANIAATDTGVNSNLNAFVIVANHVDYENENTKSNTHNNPFERSNNLCAVSSVSPSAPSPPLDLNSRLLLTGGPYGGVSALSCTASFLEFEGVTYSRDQIFVCKIEDERDPDELKSRKKRVKEREKRRARRIEQEEEENRRRQNSTGVMPENKNRNDGNNGNDNDDFSDQRKASEIDDVKSLIMKSLLRENEVNVRDTNTAITQPRPKRFAFNNHSPIPEFIENNSKSDFATAMMMSKNDRLVGAKNNLSTITNNNHNSENNSSSFSLNRNLARRDGSRSGIRKIALKSPYLQKPTTSFKKLSPEERRNFIEAQSTADEESDSSSSSSGSSENDDEGNSKTPMSYTQTPFACSPLSVPPTPLTNHHHNQHQEIKKSNPSMSKQKKEQKVRSSSSSESSSSSTSSNDDDKNLPKNEGNKTEKNQNKNGKTKKRQQNDGKHNRAPTPSSVSRVSLEAAKDRARRMQHEAHVLANLAHPCIIGFVEYFSRGGQRHLVLEYMDQGDLASEIRRRRDAHQNNNNINKNNGGNSNTTTMKYLTQDSTLFVAVQITLGLEYLHRHNILHRDIKPANILLSKKWLAKIADFGSALQFDDDVDSDVSFSGKGQSPLYMSPEQFVQSPLGSRRPYSEKADVWALGCVMYELVELHPPFSGPTIEQLARSIVFDAPRPMSREKLSPDLVALIMAMLSKDPKKRPTCKEILQTRIMMTALDLFVMRYAKAVNGGQHKNQQQNSAQTNNNTPTTTTTTTSSTSSVSDTDRLWLKVLEEHRDLVFQDTVPSQKSRSRSTRRRSQERQEKALTLSSTNNNLRNSLTATGGK